MSHTFALLYSKADVKGNTHPFVLVWDSRGRFLGAVDKPEALRLGWDPAHCLEGLPVVFRPSARALRALAPYIPIDSPCRWEPIRPIV